MRQQEKRQQKPVLRLASASPRRRQLLELIGVPHLVTPADIDETPQPGESSAIYVSRLAREKAVAVHRKHKNLPVLAADTTVDVEGVILEKPADEADCVHMLSLLSGRRHDVFTAVCCVGGRLLSLVCVHTAVEFRRIPRREMRAYWKTGEPQGKAGAYAIQGFGAVFVQKITGSYTNVMGLPLCETADMLRACGIPVWNGALAAKGKK